MTRFRTLLVWSMLGVGLGSSGLACGNAADDSEQAEPDLEVESSPQPVAPEPEDQEPPEAALLAPARKARGAGYRERYLASTRASPARHYLLNGAARFVFHDDSAPPRDFTFEVALAGPSLQRYQLADGARKNWFMIGGPGDSWIKTPDDTEPRPNSVGAGELEEDAALRWLILGFPSLLEGSHQRRQAADWSTAWSTESPVVLDPAFGQGNLQLWLDPESGLPTRVERLDDQGQANLLLEVSDWSLEYEGDSGVRVYPRRWSWHRESWRLEETVESIEDRALFLDIAFRPKQAPLSTFQVRRGSDGSTQAIPVERFALVEHSMRYRELSEQPAADDPARVWEFRRPTETVFVEQLDEQAQGSGVQIIDAQLCLLWSSPKVFELDEAADARIREIAEQNGFTVIGPIWIHTEVAGLEVLLPVQPMD